MKRLHDTAPLPRVTPTPVIKFDHTWKTIRPIERQMLREIQRTRKTASAPLEDALLLAIAFVMALLAGAGCLVILAALLGGAVSP